MDIKGMLSSEPSASAKAAGTGAGTGRAGSASASSSTSEIPQQRKPDLQPRLSINNLVNAPSDAPPVAPAPKRPSPIQASSSSSSIVSGNFIRQRNSIINITNDNDVDIQGNKTPSVARRYSSSEQNSPLMMASASGRPSALPAPLTQQSPQAAAQQHAAAPHTVKKRSIQEELDLFDRLEQNSGEGAKKKPIRYKKPPMWALDWVPQMKKRKALAPMNGNIKGPGRQIYGGSGTRTSSRLEAPSISGVEPSHDLEYAVASWIYAILNEVAEQDKPYLEIELKFGQIYTKDQDERLQLPINTETVLNLEFFHKNCFFKPGLPRDVFQNCQQFLEMINKKHYKATDRFMVEKSNHRDNFWQKHERGNKPIDARITYDIETNRQVECIDKRRISDLFIYSPATNFDLRCSISLEVPLQVTEDEERKISKTVTMIREKLRTSFYHNQTFTKIDLTNVKTFDKNHGSARVKPPDENYELELELNCNELVASYMNLQNDSQYYYDIIKTFLNNGRLINKELT